jgi:hypothetical protein
MLNHDSGHACREQRGHCRAERGHGTTELPSEELFECPQLLGTRTFIDIQTNREVAVSEGPRDFGSHHDLASSDVQATDVPTFDIEQDSRTEPASIRRCGQVHPAWAEEPAVADLEHLSRKFPCYLECTFHESGTAGRLHEPR